MVCAPMGLQCLVNVHIKMAYVSLVAAIKVNFLNIYGFYFSNSTKYFIKLFDRFPTSVWFLLLDALLSLKYRKEITLLNKEKRNTIA